MNEILTSHGFETVVETLNLYGQRTYQYLPTEDSYWANAFEIWELPCDELQFLVDYFSADEAWNEKFPGIWWRYSEDANLHCHRVDNVLIHYTPIYVWLNDSKDDISFTKDEYCRPVLNRSYPNILAYCVEEIGASTPTNICAVCTGLAKLNNMSLSDLFKTYMEGANG